MIKKENHSFFTLLYLCFMTVYMGIREVLPLNFLIDNDLVSLAVFVPGFILIVWDLLTARKCLNGRSQDLLILFLAVCGISCVINMEYGVFGNVKLIAALVIEYFVFFTLTKNMPKERKQKYLDVLGVTLVITWFVLVAVSIATYFFGIDIVVSHYGAFSITSQGFSYEYIRLWGIFQDPNYASIISMVSVWLSVRWIIAKKHPVITVLLIFNIFCQLCYLILGASRTALIAFVVTSFLFAVYRFIVNGQKKDVKGAFKGVFAAVLAFGVCIGAFFGLKFALPFIKIAVFPGTSPAAQSVAQAYASLYSLSDIGFDLQAYDAKGEVIFSKTVEGPAIPKDPSATVDPTEPIDPETPEIPETPEEPEMPERPDGSIRPLDRTDLGKEDLSNGRFIRWQQSVEVFLKAPIFGTSPRNMSAFAKVHNPETLMAKYGMAPHNGYLDVLVETGVVGFAVLAITVLWILFSFVKRCLKAGFSYERALFLLSIVAFMVFAFFASDIYMTFSVNSMFFWIFMGMAHNEETEPQNNGIVYTAYNKTIGKLTDKIFGKKG